MLIPPSGEKSVVISYGILDANIQNNFQNQFIMNKKFSFKAFLNRISTWFNTSNRKRHLLGGFIVGLFAFSPYAAIYAAAVAASCLELKDRAYGNDWDWTDWTLTVIGGAAAALILLAL